eukprot:GHVN01075103.1.p1 GENE.GHVN01075103.1~~GHVN01075103.1.p1  ORF type:complete len:502 (-),score=63.62 GHVN01075103.1:85-1590(-)
MPLKEILQTHQRLVESGSLTANTTTNTPTTNKSSSIAAQHENSQDIASSEEQQSKAVVRTAKIYKLKPRTKVVVRLLPPNVTEDEFFSTIKEFETCINWREFIPGKRRRTPSKPSRNAVAYLNFNTTEDADRFIRCYHGHQFIDELGVYYKAVAAMAPYQKVPKVKKNDKKKDSAATAAIYSDPDYLAFCAEIELAKGTSLKTPHQSVVNPKDLFTIEEANGIVVTPLVKAIRTKHGSVTKGSFNTGPAYPQQGEFERRTIAVGIHRSLSSHGQPSEGSTQRGVKPRKERGDSEHRPTRLRHGSHPRRGQGADHSQGPQGGGRAQLEIRPKGSRDKPKGDSGGWRPALLRHLPPGSSATGGYRDSDRGDRASESGRREYQGGGPGRWQGGGQPQRTESQCGVGERDDTVSDAGSSEIGGRLRRGNRRGGGADWVDGVERKRERGGGGRRRGGRRGGDGYSDYEERRDTRSVRDDGVSAPRGGGYGEQKRGSRYRGGYRGQR